MRKPSIFSRDYEKQIKKRKRIIIVISIIVLLLVGSIIFTVTAKYFDFTNVKAKIQQWVDGDTSSENIIEDIPSVENSSETPIESTVKLIDIKVSEDRILKVEYEDIGGVIKFKEAKEVPDGIEYNISPSRELILINDDKQNIKIINTKGEENNITKESYIAPNGEVFKKDVVQSTYNDYLWHKSAKFISDKKIVYKTNMPYFGYGLSQYLWIVDIDSKNETTLWQSKGVDITVGEIKEKGLEVIIDGNIKYINNDNNLIN